MWTFWAEKQNWECDFQQKRLQLNEESGTNLVRQSGLSLSQHLAYPEGTLSEDRTGCQFPTLASCGPWSSVTHCTVVSLWPVQPEFPSASLLNLLHCPNFNPRRFAAFTLYSLYRVICVPNSVVSTIICMLMTSNLWNISSTLNLIGYWLNTAILVWSQRI